MKEKFYCMDIIGNWTPSYEDYIDLDKFIISVDNQKFNIIHYKQIYKNEYEIGDFVRLYLVLFRIDENKKEEFLIKIEK